MTERLTDVRASPPTSDGGLWKETEMPKTPFTATAVWLRNLGEDGNTVQLLVEIDGHWRIAISDHFAPGQSNVSHIAEGNGMPNWPFDPVTEAPDAD